MNDATKPTVQEFQAAAARAAGRNLSHWAKRVPEDKLEWVPGEPGVTKAKSVATQLAHCVTTCRRVASVIRGQAAPTSPASNAPTLEQARMELEAASGDLADAISGASDEVLAGSLDTPIGPIPGYRLIQLVTGNMMYHGGVINAYQLMWGDDEFSFAPTPG